MQRPTKSRSRPRRLAVSKKKGLGLDKLSIDDVIDEGYLSGNPPSNTSTTQQPTVGSSPKHGPYTSPVKTLPDSSMSKYKKKAETVSRTRNGDASHPNEDQDASARPRMLQRSESRTFVFVYDEEEKKSKAVAAPDDLNVDVPVLLQYNLTEDAIERCYERPDVGASPTKQVGPEIRDVDVTTTTTTMDNGRAPGGKFSSPTAQLLRDRERDEMKNKGMHVVKWLINMERSEENGKDTQSEDRMN